MRILVADQNTLLLAAITATFGPHCDLVTANRRDVCLALLEQHKFDVVIACDKLSDYTGLELLSEVPVISPETLLIFAANPKRLNQLGKRLAVFGLFDALSYPLTPQKLVDVLKRARERLRAARGQQGQQSQPRQPAHQGQSPSQTVAANQASQPAQPKVRHVVLESEWDTGERLGLMARELQAELAAKGRTATHDEWSRAAEAGASDDGSRGEDGGDDFVFEGPPPSVQAMAEPGRGDGRSRAGGSAGDSAAGGAQDGGRGAGARPPSAGRTFEGTPVVSAPSARAGGGGSVARRESGVIEYEVKGPADVGGRAHSGAGPSGNLGSGRRTQGDGRPSVDPNAGRRTRSEAGPSVDAGGGQRTRSEAGPSAGAGAGQRIRGEAGPSTGAGAGRRTPSEVGPSAGAGAGAGRRTRSEVGPSAGAGQRTRSEAGAPVGPAAARRTASEVGAAGGASQRVGGESFPALTHESGRVESDAGDEFVFAARPEPMGVAAALEASSMAAPDSAAVGAFESVGFATALVPSFAVETDSVIDVEPAGVPVAEEPDLDELCGNDPVFDGSEGPTWGGDGAANDLAFEKTLAPGAWRRGGTGGTAGHWRGIADTTQSGGGYESRSGYASGDSARSSSSRSGAREDSRSAHGSGSRSRDDSRSAHGSASRSRDDSRAAHGGGSRSRATGSSPSAHSYSAASNTPHSGQAHPAAPNTPHSAYAHPVAPNTPHSTQAHPAAPNTPHSAHAHPVAPNTPHSSQPYPGAPNGSHATHAYLATPGSPHSTHSHPAATNSPYSAQANPHAHSLQQTEQVNGPQASNMAQSARATGPQGAGATQSARATGAQAGGAAQAARVNGSQASRAAAQAQGNGSQASNAADSGQSSKGVESGKSAHAGATKGAAQGGKAAKAPAAQGTPQRKERTQANPTASQLAAFERAMARRNASQTAGSQAASGSGRRRGGKGAVKTEPTIQLAKVDNLFAGASASDRPSSSLSDLARMATKKRPLAVPNLGGPKAGSNRTVFAVSSGLAAVLVLGVLTFELLRNSHETGHHMRHAQAQSMQVFSSSTTLVANRDGSGAAQLVAPPPEQTGQSGAAANLPQAETFDADSAPADPPPPPALEHPGPMEPPSMDHGAPPTGMMPDSDGSSE